MGVLVVVGLAAAGVRAGAQEPPRATLTLEEALELARRYSPAFQIERNDEAAADWAVREAYTRLLLPTAGADLTLQYQASGVPRFGIFTGADVGLGRTPPYYSSSYSLGLSYRLSGQTLFEPGRAQAQRRATEARIRAADFTLATEVTRQYLAVLGAGDGVVLARQELERAEENLRLARARVGVGAATPIDEKQAEVERGRAEVALIQAENLHRSEELALMERLGIALEHGLELTSRFEVFAPEWSAQELLAGALAAHPQLRSLVAAEQASRAGARMARSAYLPTVDVFAGWSGFTREAGDAAYLIAQGEDRARNNMQNCQAANEIFSRLTPPLEAVDCQAEYGFTEGDRQRILEGNDVFPFRFSEEPLLVQLRISLPIFTGLSRERQRSTAEAEAADARHRRRAEELRLRREVLAAHQELEAAYRSVELEVRNAELAAEQLRLARERYRLGAANFLELSDAETVKARADRGHLGAVYTFHNALARLENAVGRPLRRPAGAGAPEPGSPEESRP